MKAATLYAWNQYDYVEISIHAAREGGDIDKLTHTLKSIISIHAAREGGDLSAARRLHRSSHFNPRRP